MKEIEVFSSNDDFVIERICTIFKERDIPYIKKENETGNYTNISFKKSSMAKTRIIVSSENYKKAKELLDFLNAEEVNKEKEKKETSNQLKAIKVDEFGNKIYGWPSKILAALAGVIFIVVIAFWIIKVLEYLK